MVAASATAAQVLARLEAHEARCEVLNEQTVNAFSSMSESHRALALEMKTTREEFSARWDKLNATAWKGLGAIALTILAGIVGVAAQNFVQWQDTSQKATLAATSAQQATSAQKAVLTKLNTIQAAQQAASNASGP